MARVLDRMTALRPMTFDDLDQVVALEARTYGQPWTAKVFRDELTAPSRTYIVAEADGRIVGYAGMMVVGDDAHVNTVAVDPDVRGAALGTRLMLHLIEAGLAAEARNLTLEVRTSNSAAQALYRKFGMAPVGVRKNYYRNEDALIMWAHDIDSDDYSERIEAIRRGIA